MITTNVSKENNLGPGNTIRYIWGLKGISGVLKVRFLFCKSAAGPHYFPISILNVIIL